MANPCLHKSKRHASSDSYSLGARWIHTMLARPLENHWINIADDTVESISPRPAYPQAEHLGEQSQILPASYGTRAGLVDTKLSVAG